MEHLPLHHAQATHWCLSGSGIGAFSKLQQELVPSSHANAVHITGASSVNSYVPFAFAYQMPAGWRQSLQRHDVPL